MALLNLGPPFSAPLKVLSPSTEDPPPAGLGSAKRLAQPGISRTASRPSRGFNDSHRMLNLRPLLGAWIWKNRGRDLERLIGPGHRNDKAPEMTDQQS